MGYTTCDIVLDHLTGLSARTYTTVDAVIESLPRPFRFYIGNLDFSIPSTLASLKSRRSK